jgi:hypothetical protein
MQHYFIIKKQQKKLFFCNQSFENEKKINKTRKCKCVSVVFQI